MKTEIAVLGIDLGKNSCSLAGLDGTGAVINMNGSIKAHSASVRPLA
jgi:hypothetical protein